VFALGGASLATVKPGHIVANPDITFDHVHLISKNPAGTAQ